MIRDQKLRDKRNYDNFLNESELEKFRSHSKKVSLFLKKLGKRRIWKPDRFVSSRRVKIAESYDQLISLGG